MAVYAPSTAPPIIQATSADDRCVVRMATTAPAAAKAKNGIPSFSRRTVRLYPRPDETAVSRWRLATGLAAAPSGDCREARACRTWVELACDVAYRAHAGYAGG